MKSHTRLILVVSMPVLLLLMVTSGAEAAARERKTGIRHLNLDFKAYAVCSEDLDGDGRAEIVAGSFDDRIHVVDDAGTRLWSADVGGLPYALAVGDIDGDGVKDIVAVVHNATGELIALGYKKGILWRFALDRPFTSVAIGDFKGDGKREVAAGSFLGALLILDAKSGKLKAKKILPKKSSISALAFGDIEMAPGDEILVGTSNRGVYALNQGLGVLWHLRPKVKRKHVKGKKTGKHVLHPRHKIENVQTICIEDLAGDGTAEVVVGSTPNGMVTVLGGRGEVLWQKNFPDIMNNTTAASVAVGNFLGDGKQELFCLLSGVVLRGKKGTSQAALLDSRGNVIRFFDPPTGFFSAASGRLADQSHADVILASSVRGSGIDLLKLGNDTGSEFRWDLPGETEVGLDRWLKAGTRISEGVNQDGRTFHFLYRCSYSHIYGKSPEALRRFLAPLFAVPGDHAVVLTSLYEATIEHKLGKRKRRQALKSDEIVGIAGWFEKHKIPFYLDAGKHARFYFELNTLERILQRARTSCRGFIVDENNFTRALLWNRFVHDLEGLLEILVRFPGKKLIMNEYLGFWHRFPHDAAKFEKLFKSRYKNILVPVYKPNNMKTPELNMGSLVGLWKSGTVQNWGVGIYSDMWKWGPVFRPSPGDVLLRLAVEAISLGANYFVFARNVSEYSQDVLDLAPNYKSYFAPLYDLVSAGIIAPIEKPESLLLSSLAIQEMPNQAEIQKRALGTKIYWQEIYRMKGMLDTGFLLQTVRDNYLPRYCYDMSKHYDGLFPINPNGYVTLFPGDMDPLKVQGIQKCFVVKEGRLYVREGKTLKAARTGEVTSNLEKLGGELPFGTPDAFLSAHRTKEGYRVYLINPHMIENKAVEAHLTHNLTQSDVTVRDVISGEMQRVQEGRSYRITVPAGLFRILKVHAK